ncbi:unnamed protein product [Durusdinium trenchii]|uniref:Uncharacterized protein n=2 Tax=Durusdinium trenchii TaxID=1381693 RepID=A0ABP0QM68_9DINO
MSSNSVSSNEDEFANRDHLGLQPLTQETETEDRAFFKYLRLVLAVLLVGLVVAGLTYLAAKHLGSGAILERKFNFIHENQLGYVFLCVWIAGMTRSGVTVLANAARAGARVDRPDQHVYKIMESSGSLKDAPYVLMANTGTVGRFNRAQRAAFNMDESLPLLLVNTVLASSVFGPWILLPMLLYCFGRLSFSIKYRSSLKERSAGFLPSLIGEKWVEGLVLFSAIKGLTDG